MKTLRWCGTISAAVITFLLLTDRAISQSTDAFVSGLISDPSGAGVPNVHVTARNVNTGVTTETRANHSGVYVFAALQPGLYQLSAELPGFQKYVVRDLELDVAARLTLDLQLKIGAPTESIEVRADAVLQLDLLSASVGTVINGRKVLELPLAGRNAMDLLRTQAGVTGSNGGQNFNGARVGSLNISVDGTNAQDNLITVDPTVAHAMRSCLPLIWTHDVFGAPAAADMYEEARAHGIKSGISLPLHGAGDMPAMVSFASDMPMSEDRTLRT